jgi:hypothetical protein
MSRHAFWLFLNFLESVLWLNEAFDLLSRSQANDSRTLIKLATSDMEPAQTSHRDLPPLEHDQTMNLGTQAWTHACSLTQDR